jgi:shikimate kinase
MIVFLTGFMGCGKSRIAREISRKQGWDNIDTDKEIEKRAGMSVKEIFSIKGERYFRSLEESIIEEISRFQTDCVVALGGGALISDWSLHTVLEKGILIYIKSEPEEIYKRVWHTSKRPLLQENNTNWDRETFLVKITDLLRIREPGYTQAHLTIHRDHIEAEEVADRIISYLKKEHHV